MHRQSFYVVLILAGFVAGLALLAVWSNYASPKSPKATELFKNEGDTSVASDSLTSFVISTDPFLLLTDPHLKMIKAKTTKYSLVAGTVLQYSRHLRDLRVQLSSSICHHGSSICSPALNATLNCILELISTQLQQWEDFENFMESSIDLFRMSLNPPKNESLLFYSILHEALRSNANVKGGDASFVKSASLKPLIRLSAILAPFLTSLSNKKIGQAGTYMLPSSPNRTASSVEHAMLYRALNAIGLDKLVFSEVGDFVDVESHYRQILSWIIDQSEKWVNIFQKDILLVKFHSKASSDKLMTKTRSKQNMDSAEDNERRRILDPNRPYSALWNDSSDGSSNIVDKFLDNVADAADSVESKLKAAEKFVEDQVESGASLETVVRLNDEDQPIRAIDDHSSPDGIDKNRKLTGNGMNDEDTVSSRKPELATTLVDFESNQYVLAKPKDPTAHYEDSRLIYDIFLLLCFSFLLACFFEYVLGLPSFFGYVLAGLLLGPSCFSMIKNVVQISSLAQFGVYFMLFVLGCEVDSEKLGREWKRSVFSYLGFSLILIVLCLIMSAFWGSREKFALSPLEIATSSSSGASSWEVILFALSLSLSSTAVSLKLLAHDNKPLPSHLSSMFQPLSSSNGHRLFGRAMLGILVTQDILLCLLLAVFPALTVGSTSSGGNFGALFKGLTLGGCSALLIGLLCFFLKKFVLIRFMTLFLKLYQYPSSNGEVNKATSLPAIELLPLGLVVYCLLIAKLCDYCGLSMEFGCFLAGVLLNSSLSGLSSSSPHGLSVPLHKRHSLLHHLVVKLHPINDFFSIFFFNSIGLHVNPHFLLSEISALVFLSLFLIVVKTVLLMLILVILFKMPPVNSFFTALGLSHISEFSFVLASKAKAEGLFSRESYYIMVGLTSCCLVIVPLLWKIAWKLMKERVDAEDARFPGYLTLSTKRQMEDLSPYHNAKVEMDHHPPFSDEYLSSTKDGFDGPYRNAGPSISLSVHPVHHDRLPTDDNSVSFAHSHSTSTL